MSRSVKIRVGCVPGHLALNLLRQEPSAKSLPRKRLACALNPDYLLKVLLGKQF